MTPGAVLGVDVGGTFTDVVLTCPERPQVTGKYLTTPHDVADAALRGIGDVLQRAGLAPEAVGRVVHATTLATNTILEQRGVPVAFVTTEGFRDLLALGRQALVEEDRYDLMAEGAQVPVPLSHCFEVRERIGAGGEILTPLDEADARAKARAIAELDVQAVAICLLHSYARPDHERRVAELLREELGPAVVIACSHEIWPELREYDRATTTLMSAYVGPVMGGYLRDLKSRLRAAGITAPLHIMDSAGGVMSAERAADVAVRTLESGPAAGVIAARRAGLDTGVRDLLAFDMGGTTAKAGIVRDGTVAITRDFQAGGKGSFGGRRAGTGVPVKVPAVDLAEVGSGGGSIAWVDGGGVLHVGPRSAGAHPGPACYGFGGAAATVTDADLVLGYLDPDTFAGGTLRLHPELAGKAIDELAGRLRCDRLQAAHAIAHIADAGMGFAVHVVTVQRGIDPRRFTLVASGGAGPMHAARIAERFGITSVLVPDASGVSSAVGLLDCDLTTERSRTLPVALALADVTAVRELAGPFATLEAEARRDLEADAAAAGAAIRMTREVDLRYRGQAFALTVPVPHDALDTEAVAALANAFHTEYALSYGSHADVALELVTIRVRALLAVDRATPGAAAVAGEPVIGSRPMSFTSADGYRPTPVLRRERMPIGYAITGPAVIEDAGSTTVVPPGWHADLLPGRTLRLSRDATSA